MRSRAGRVILVVAALLVIAWWRLAAPTVPPAPAALPGPPGSAATAPAPPSPQPSAGRDRASDRYDLGRDEQRGGHTLARHVGRTDAQLFERLDRERNISAASTYTDRAIAERTVARALIQARTRVDQWLARQGTRPNLAIDYRGRADEVLGRSARRGRPNTVPCTDAVVVLRWDRGQEFFVLTSYPEAR
jgi:CDI toxin RNase A-like protein